MTNLNPTASATAERFQRELAGSLTVATVVRTAERLGPRTTLRVGGPADVYVEPATEGDLAVILRWCVAREVAWFVLGRGSNVLVRDGGIRGVVLGLNQPAFCSVTVRECQITAGAGAPLKHVAVEARRAGLGGLEFLEGIPGSVGGGLRMNAGAMGSSLFDRVDRVRLMQADGRVEEMPGPELSAAYRGCAALRGCVALAAVFNGHPAPKAAIEQRTREFNERRWRSQPAAPSAGCVFKNPSAVAAGRLVEEAGLKGCRVGGAVVSPVHGNFIVNDGGATAADVLGLIALVRERIETARGIRLEPELEIVGEGS